MKLHQVRDMIAVADKGSLRAASRHLGIAQSAITRSIRQLEHELSTALFERRKRGTVLTPMGKIFLRRPRIAASELGRAREEIQRHRGGRRWKRRGLSFHGASRRDAAAHAQCFPQTIPWCQSAYCRRPHVSDRPGAA
ncbi:LysR family transcriptional regulator [Bradyrhizobium sp. SRL28]|nr:LysR family transcriptional regulator [Bradyrhizobium sp. SRL28]